MTLYVNEIMFDEIEIIEYEDQGPNGTWLHMIFTNGEDQYIDIEKTDYVRVIR